MGIAYFGTREKAMKITVLPLVIVFLMTSCTLDDTTIINRSDDQVTVWFDHTGPFILEPGDPIQVGTFGNMARHISYTPESFVYFRHNESRSMFIFDNRPRFPISIVRNFSGEPITLVINGPAIVARGTYINAAGNIELDESDDKKDAGYIYTRTPQFTAFCNLGSPMHVLYYFDDEDKSFQVSIR